MRRARQNARLKVIRRDLESKRLKASAPKPESKKPVRVVAMPSSVGRMRETGLFGPGRLYDPADPNGTIFRPIGQGMANRTLPDYLADEMHRQADRYIRENPFIKRLNKMTTDFICGDGLKLSSKNDQIGEVLNEWWSDPINNWEENQFDECEKFRGRGEIAFEEALNIVTGQVRLNPLDPLFISRVTGHPAYNAIPNKVWWRTRAGEKPTQIINGVPPSLRDPSPGLPRAFYFRANKQGLRGYSDWYCVFEWADSLDNASFSLLERMINLQMVVWHYKSASFGDQEQMDATEEKLTQMRGNSILMTDENEELTAVVPQFGAAEFVQGFDKVRQIIATGGEVPENWLSVAGVANVGEANAMDAVTFRAMRRKQRGYITVHRHMANHAIVEAKKRGRVPAKVFDEATGKLVDPWDAYTIDVDPISKRESTSIVQQLVGLSSALPTFQDFGYIDSSEARDVVRHVIGEIKELVETTKDDDDLGRDVQRVFTPKRMEELRKIDAALRGAA